MSYISNISEFSIVNGIQELNLDEIGQVEGGLSDAATAGILIGAGLVVGVGLGVGAVAAGVAIFAAIAAE